MQIASTPPTPVQTLTSGASLSPDVAANFMQVLQSVPAGSKDVLHDVEMEMPAGANDTADDVEFDEHGIPVDPEEPESTVRIEAYPARNPEDDAKKNSDRNIPSLALKTGLPRTVPETSIRRSSIEGMKQVQQSVTGLSSAPEGLQRVGGEGGRVDVPKEQMARKNGVPKSSSDPLSSEAVSAGTKMAKPPIDSSLAGLKNGILAASAPPTPSVKIGSSEVAQKRSIPDRMSSAAGGVIHQLQQATEPLLVPLTVQPTPKPELTMRDAKLDRVSVEIVSPTFAGISIKEAPHAGQYTGSVSLAFPSGELISNAPIDLEIPGLGPALDARASNLPPAALTSSQSHPPQSFTPATAHQVAMAVHKNQDGVTELVLNPEELGRVRLAMNSQDGVMAVTITTERPDTQDLIRRHIDMLAQEMRALGYESVGFTFEGQSDDPKGGQSNDGQAHEQDAQLAGTQTPLVMTSSGLDLRL